jgi:ParB family chromosome partitioning protein
VERLFHFQRHELELSAGNIYREGGVMAETYEKGKLYQLPLSELFADPEQPRKFFDEQALTELQASIAVHGVLQPILVRAGADGNFIIVSGERRFQAAKNAGLETIPAIITDGEPAEIAIIENLLRENLTAIEEAEAIERLRGVHDYGFSELATALGKAESTLSEILSLNRLPAEVKDDCRNDPKAARGILTVIARQKTPEKMVTLYQKYKQSGLTRGEIIKQSAPKPVKQPFKPADVAAFSEKLDLVLDTGVTIEDKAGFILELTKLRSVALQKMKLFKG